MSLVKASFFGDEFLSKERSGVERRLNPILDVLNLARRRIRLIAATVILVLGVVVAYLALATPSYRAMVEIFIDPQALQVVGRGLTRTDTAASIEFAGIDSQALILTSTSLLERVIADLNLDQDPVLAAGSTNEATRSITVLDALRQRIVVRRVDASLVFQVTVSHPIAVQAARIANAIGAAYFSLSSQDRGKAVGKASATLVDQAAQLRGDLAKADAAVETFKAKAGLISTGEAGLIVSQQLKDLYTQISLSEANLPRLAARRNEIRKLNAAQITAENGATPEAIVSPVIGALRAQYASIIQNEAQLARTLGDRHPELANIREQKRAVLEQIQNELGRIGRSSDEEYRRAQESLTGLKKQAETLVNSQIASNESKIRLRQLESEASAIRSVYDTSTARAKELQQQQQIETNNSRIISEAMVPLRPFGTPKALVLVAGALFGLVLGFALAYVMDLFRGVLSNRDDVADTALAPIVADLATVPVDGIRSGGDSRSLIEIAKTLRQQLGGRLPAVIVVAGLSENDSARIADDITEILVWCGEAVLRCHGGIGKNAVSSKRMCLPTSLNRVVTQGAGETRFIVVNAAAEMVAADPELSARASAILLVVEPGQTTRDGLNNLLDVVDPNHDRRQAGQVGLICLRPEKWTMPAWLSPQPEATMPVGRAA
jgi:uncharacterized protein involved in exopolysaccharide biosynthesis